MLGLIIFGGVGVLILAFHNKIANTLSNISLIKELYKPLGIKISVISFGSILVLMGIYLFTISTMMNKYRDIEGENNRCTMRGNTLYCE